MLAMVFEGPGRNIFAKFGSKHKFKGCRPIAYFSVWRNVVGQTICPAGRIRNKMQGKLPGLSIFGEVEGPTEETRCL